MARLKDRFETAAGRKPAALAAMRRQKVLRDCGDLAQALLDAGDIREIGQGVELIKEGDSDSEVYFLLMGIAEIRVKGNPVGERMAGEMLGEIAALKPSNRRTASVVTLEPCVVLQLAADKLAQAADEHAVFWRNTSEVMSERLGDRNRMLAATNEKPLVLVFSSGEAIGLVRQIETNLGDDGTIAIEPWDKVFAISAYPISELKAAIGRADFVVAIMRGDDVLISRNKRRKAPRDNVVLEYGMALGCLGPERSIMLRPTDVDVKLATDKDGLTYVGYREGDVKPSLRIACNKIREHIQVHKIKRAEKPC